jgi:hypothetical protein
MTTTAPVTEREALLAAWRSVNERATALLAAIGMLAVRDDLSGLRWESSSIAVQAWADRLEADQLWRDSVAERDAS